MKIQTLLILILCSIPAVAQTGFSKLKTANLPENVALAAIDRVGELYVITEKNRLIKFGVDGDILASTDINHFPDIFDPRDGSHSFLYWRDEQKYEFRLPDLASIAVANTIDSSFAVAPFMVCPSGDHDVIVLDSADWSLKKISTAGNTVLYETIIFASGIISTDISSMREYQNFVFILDKTKGIYIFNRMGKLLRTINAKGIPYFNFLGEEIYYPEGNGLRFFDLFTAEERFVALPSPFTFALLSDERLYLIRDRELVIHNVIR
jgi:hypothetical protein